MSPPRSNGRRRILFAGADGMNRRLRMSMKVIQELRRRRAKCLIVAFKDVPDEFHRMAAPDEIHTELSESELMNLFRSASMLLEAVDDGEQESPAADLARAVGLPIICHAGASPVEPCHVVTEWSADAFADALIAVDLKHGLADEGATETALRRLAANLE